MGTCMHTQGTLSQFCHTIFSIVRVICVSGIGGKVRDSEMEQIASGTTLANVLTVEKFEELEDISDEVEDFICDSEST